MCRLGWLSTHIVAAGVALSLYPQRVQSQDKSSERPAFTSDEREGLRIDTDSIRNRALGFAFPNPSATFIIDRVFGRRIASQFGGEMPPDYLAWILRDTAARQGIAIQVRRNPGLDEAGFRSFMKGIKEGSSGATVLQDDLIWSETRHEAGVTFRHPSGVYAIRCVARLAGHGDYTICINTYSQDSLALAAVRKGLTFSR